MVVAAWWSKASAAVLLPRSPQSSVQLHGHGDPGTLLLRVRGLSELADTEGREAKCRKGKGKTRQSGFGMCEGRQLVQAMD